MTNALAKYQGQGELVPKLEWKRTDTTDCSTVPANVRCAKVALCNSLLYITGLHYYYYYAAFNAPCVGNKDDESQAREFLHQT